MVFVAGLEVGSTVVVDVLPFWWPLNWRVATLRILTPDLEPGWNGVIQFTEQREETQGQRGQVACPIPFQGQGWEGSRCLVPRVPSWAQNFPSQVIAYVEWAQ